MDGATTELAAVSDSGSDQSPPRLVKPGVLNLQRNHRVSENHPRVLLVTNLYHQLLEDTYSSNPDLAACEYETQVDRLLAAAWDVADSYRYELRVLECQADVVVVNADSLQSLWAERHGLRADGNIHDQRRRIAEAQVEYYDPDVVVIFEWSPLGDTFVRRIKSPKRFIVGQLASNLPPNRTFSDYDLILSSWPPLIEYFRKRGISAEPLALGFDDRVLDRLDHSQQRYDVTFVGGLGTVHSRRVKWLESILREVDLDIFGYGHDGTAEGSLIRRKHRGPVWGRSMYDTLHRSRITLNMHGSITVGHRDVNNLANNMRLFEATGVGTCLVTDAKDNMVDLFKPETEVVTYRDDAECVEKIRHLLSHEDHRSAIARAGQQRTLRDHTNAHRVKELLDIVARIRS